MHGRRDERGLESRDTGRKERLPRPPVAGRIRGREVDTAEAVQVQIDESWDRDPASTTREPDRPDPAILDGDVAAHESPVDEGGFDADPHDPQYAAANRPTRRPPGAPTRYGDARGTAILTA